MTVIGDLTIWDSSLTQALLNFTIHRSLADFCLMVSLHMFCDRGLCFLLLAVALGLCGCMAMASLPTWLYDDRYAFLSALCPNP